MRLDAAPETRVRDAFETSEFDLYVRGMIPACMTGSLVIATSRRHKSRSLFSRWHDSQADLLKLDLTPGRPGRVRASFLATNPDWPAGITTMPSPFYATQPNHGLNCREETIWATNLLFGAPLEVDLPTWRPRRVLRYLEPSDSRPQVTSTSHFAWSLDGRYAYFHQSLLERERDGRPVRAADLTLFELDTVTGQHRSWRILPPADDAWLDGANFHSAFYFEERGKRYVGLLRTGAVLEELAAHRVPAEHQVVPMRASTIWIMQIDDRAAELRASLLPGVRELGGFALSHLDIDASSRDGFELYANYKQSDVAEETHGVNLYGEDPRDVPEHYAGMIIEAFNYGRVIRYSRRNGEWRITTFSRPYVPGKTSAGHSWLPINIQLGSSRERVFCSFSGFRPRLLPRHVARAYEGLVANVDEIAYVPPLLMRMNAGTLEPDTDPRRRHLSYAEPVAFAIVPGADGSDFVCTFSPEFGLRIYSEDDLTTMIGHAIAGELMTYRDSHYRPMPAHMAFIPR
ncbi:MAG TPA: hypothetical protein VIT43_03805 [Candidatus Dormibacteraeota bacterium]